MFSKHIQTEIEINATTDDVWSVLSETSSYPDWNPFIQKFEGKLEVGSKLNVSIHPPNGNAMTFKPTLLEVNGGVKLRWLGHFLVPGIFDGEHIFRIESLDSKRSKFIQEERFKGILIPFFKGVFESTEKGFGEMNTALKNRVEASGSR